MLPGDLVKVKIQRLHAAVEATEGVSCIQQFGIMHALVSDGQRWQRAAPRLAPAAERTIVT